MSKKDMYQDPYQIPEIGFLDAQWMRDHKYTPLAAAAARQAREVVAARAAVDEAYTRLEKSMQALGETCAQVRARREAENAIQ